MASDPTRWHYDPQFEQYVRADLRDPKHQGPHYSLLRAKDNRVRWLETLVAAQQSIHNQNAHDNAALAAHPGKYSSARDYLQDKADVAERKRKRARAMQAIEERIREAQRLIGSDALSSRTAGRIVGQLMEIDALIRAKKTDDARGKIRGTIEWLNEEDR